MDVSGGLAHLPHVSQHKKQFCGIRKLSEPFQRCVHAVRIGIVGVVDPLRIAVAGDFHSHAWQDASGETFGNLPHRDAECRCHRRGTRRIGRLMFPGKSPVHYDAFSGPVIDQLK